jgi:hypothetical protein
VKPVPVMVTICPGAWVNGAKLDITGVAIFICH